MPLTSTHLRVWVQSLLTALFIDNRWLCYWHCHRRPERSFSINNRQFHICSRCAGILSGFLLWPLWLLTAPYTQVLLPAAVVTNILDGGTQLLGWRESNNPLRYTLGLALAAGLVTTMLNYW